jgi:hypothetical protein
MMRRILAGLGIALCLAPGVQASQAWWVPSPVSIAITVGQWLLRNNEEVFYLRVQSVAQDEQAAREEAFRLAINQAVGSLVLTERRSVNGELVRNEIINYSSGYVHDFAIVEQQRSDGSVSMTVDVWVAKSEIADRILGESKTNAQIEGGRISAQINTYDHARRSGDQVLEAVLQDFPRRSFRLHIGQTSVGVDQQRQKFLRIPIAIAWDEHYLRSLDEAVQRTSHLPDCDTWLKRQSCSNKVKAQVIEHTGYYDDEKVGMLWERAMLLDPPRVLLMILDRAGQEVYRDCWRINALSQDAYQNQNMFSANRWGLFIRHRGQITVEIPLALDRLPVDRLDRVDAVVVRQSSCPK